MHNTKTSDCPHCGQDLRLGPDARQEILSLRKAISKLAYYDTTEGCWKPSIREDADISDIVGKLLPILPK